MLFCMLQLPWWEHCWLWLWVHSRAKHSIWSKRTGLGSMGRESAMGNIMTPVFPCCHIWEPIFCRRGSCALPEGLISTQWLIFQTQGRVTDSSMRQHRDNLLCGNMAHWNRVTELLYPVAVSGRYATVTQIHVLNTKYSSLVGCKL